MPGENECRQCGKEISDYPCAFCGASALPEYRGPAGGLILLALAFTAFMLFSWWTGRDSEARSDSRPTTTATETSRPRPPAKPNLELLEHESARGRYSGTWRVVGRVRNNTNRTYRYVQVSINLYNSEEVQVGSTIANVNNLEPQGTWQFDATVTEEDATRYRIAGVSGRH